MGVYGEDHERSFHQHCSPRFLLCYMMDSFSKWLEVAVVSAATSKNTIDKLREMLVRHGIPETMVTDNGKPFTSFEFQTFVGRNGIQHCLTGTE